MNTFSNETNKDSVCNFDYLYEITKGKQHLIIDIIDAFLVQIPEELKAMDSFIASSNFQEIKNTAHSMNSTILIMGISSLYPILHNIEDLASKNETHSKITTLYVSVKSICKKAIIETENYKLITLNK